MLSQTEQQLILELYKAHYTRREVSTLLNIHYNTVASYFKGFTHANIEKANRLQLIPATAKLILRGALNGNY